MTTSFEPAIPVGAWIQGKWNKNRYRVEQLLGEGANGKVFLVSQGKRLYALKVGFDTADHQSEVNALKALSKSSTSFQDMLVESDDFTQQGVEYPFCVMRYIEGKSLTDFIKRYGTEWIPLIGLNLLRKLSELHASGFVFGDLKAENMIITGYGEVELIDFGGVTAKGRSVKQFTEVYDRGFWNGGSRTAEEGYDLFSFAVLLLQVTDRERKFQRLTSILPQNRSVEWLLELLKGRPQLAQEAPLLRKALTGRYESSKQMLAGWRARSLGSGTFSKKPAKGDWIKLCFATSLIAFGATVYLVWQ